MDQTRPSTPPATVAARPHRRCTNYTPSKRGAVYMLLEQGLTQRAIAARLNIPQTSVSTLKKHLHEIGRYYKGLAILTGTPYTLKSSGQPLAYNEEQRQALKKHTDDQPFATVREIQHASPANACLRTTQRLLYRLGVAKRPSRCKIRLTETQAQRRLAFTQE
jgi:transposase-like protein